MSFIRFSSKTTWENTDPLYVYMAATGESSRLTGFDGATPKQVVEVVMQMLEQSGELSEDNLEQCHGALRKRLRLDETEAGREPPSLNDAIFGVADAVGYANEDNLDTLQADAEDLFNRLSERRAEYLEGDTDDL